MRVGKTRAYSSVIGHSERPPYHWAFGAHHKTPVPEWRTRSAANGSFCRSQTNRCDTKPHVVGFGRGEQEECGAAQKSCLLQHKLPGNQWGYEEEAVISLFFCRIRFPLVFSPLPTCVHTTSVHWHVKSREPSLFVHFLTFYIAYTLWVQMAGMSLLQITRQNKKITRVSPSICCQRTDFVLSKRQEVVRLNVLQPSVEQIVLCTHWFISREIGWKLKNKPLFLNSFGMRFYTKLKRFVFWHLFHAHQVKHLICRAAACVFPTRVLCFPLITLCRSTILSGGGWKSHRICQCKNASFQTMSHG